MIDYNRIKLEFPLALKKLIEFNCDGIGHAELKYHEGWGWELWYFGDTPDLNCRIEDHELYRFFDKYNIHIGIEPEVIVKHRNTIVPPKIKIRWKPSVIWIPNYNGWDVAHTFTLEVTKTRKDCEQRAFYEAFYVLNKHLIKLEENSNK